MDLISIVIPVYNIKEYLTKCVISLENQTYKNIEIILVNDGSKDGSEKICEQLKEKYNNIKVFHKVNSGVSSARNLGIEKSNGKYITFIDGDDWVEKNYIETLYNALKKYNVEVSAIGFIYQFGHKSKTLKITDNIEVLSNKETLNQSCDEKKPWVGFACGKLLLKDILLKNKIRFDEEIKICEDSLFWYNVFDNVEKVVKLPENLYNYRIRLNSATSLVGKSDKLLEDKILAFEKALLLAKEKYSNTEFEYRIRKKLVSTYISYLSVLILNKKYDKSLKGVLTKIENKNIIKDLSISLKLRYYLILISPKLLYLLENIRK